MAFALLPNGSVSDDSVGGLLPNGGILVAVSSGNPVHLVTVGNSQQANQASSAAIAQGGGGTITLPALKDWGTGNVKANESGVTVIINNAATGGLVNLLNSQSANAGGVLPVLSGLASGTDYRVTVILADGSEGTWKYTAS